MLNEKYNLCAKRLSPGKGLVFSGDSHLPCLVKKKETQT